MCNIKQLHWKEYFLSLYHTLFNRYSAIIFLSSEWIGNWKAFLHHICIDMSIWIYGVAAAEIRNLSFFLCLTLFATSSRNHSAKRRKEFQIKEERIKKSVRMSTRCYCDRYFGALSVMRQFLSISTGFVSFWRRNL